MKKRNKMILMLAFVCVYFTAVAQESLPAEITSIVNMKLEDGQNKLKNLGYEICSSSFFKKKQDWYNEKSKVCVSIKFDKKNNIMEVTKNPEVVECAKGLEASRKLWENYHDGQAPVNSASIDTERDKLRKQGFSVSYWINEVSPGKTMEIWKNDSNKSGKAIFWVSSSLSDVQVIDKDYAGTTNPAPVQNK